ncbi:hypothetical protein EVAR_54013_1 [Eumeta japonica]|uniref:Uncharacterized protein n=1 Tax=Eumeta variegata TaxID=151549 RepID=A0A4C1XW67_EUMVA|nr:hypothetical protein EVAR_54013_1 [Eumeta japonica]
MFAQYVPSLRRARGAVVGNVASFPWVGIPASHRATATLTRTVITDTLLTREFIAYRVQGEDSGDDSNSRPLSRASTSHARCLYKYCIAKAVACTQRQRTAVAN